MPDSMPLHPLLSSINLDHPGLEAVRDAAERLDLSGALNELVAYFRTREEPDPESIAAADENAVEAAERAIRREFTLNNDDGVVPPGDYDWTYKPGTDWEWTWVLNRHFHWPALASAYLATRDERYAAELAYEIRTWVGNHPASVDDGAAWRTIEAGLRMGGPWPAILRAMKVSDAFSREVWLHYLRSIAEHAEMLIEHPKINNWLLMESNGLLACGLLFPEFKRASKWVRIATERFEREMARQVHPDGAHIEYSTGYIFVGIHTFTNSLERTERVLGPGHGFSNEYRDKIISMWEHVMYMMRPDGFQPMLNDSDCRDVRPQLRAAGVKYDRPGFIYAATQGAEGCPPKHLSHRFPWVRRVVMRTGWDSDALYGFFEAAPLGAGHVHEDALTFELWAYGTPLVGTMGRYTYEHVPRRMYLCNGPGHNIVLIDGAAQHWKRTDPDRSSWVATGPTDLPWTSTPEQDVAYARYDQPWADERLDGVVHERWMAFSKGDSDGSQQPFWLIRDRLSGDPADEHEFRFLLHFYPGDVVCDDANGIVTTQYGADGGNLRVAFSEPEMVALDAARGQDDPVRGWFSEDYGIIEPAWEVAVVRRSEFPVEYVAALVPFRGSEAPEVAVERTGSGARVVIDGTAHEVSF